MTELQDKAQMIISATVAGTPGIAPVYIICCWLFFTVPDAGRKYTVTAEYDSIAERDAVTLRCIFRYFLPAISWTRGDLQGNLLAVIFTGNAGDDSDIRPAGPVTLLSALSLANAKKVL